MARLNADIYLMLLDNLSSRSDISAFMRSCKALFALSARRLLRPGVSIRSDAHLVSFCRFMLRDLPARAPYLRRLFLCIELPIIDEEGSGSVYECDPEGTAREMLEGGALLVRVLRRASALEHLTIHFCEELVEREERLIAALVALKAVTHLHVTSLGVRTHEVVADIRSPLVDVSIDCALVEDNVDILQTLARHRATLERVAAWGVKLAPVPADLEPDNAAVFPRVHSLALRAPSWLDRPVLARAFPGVRVLEVAGVRTQGELLERQRAGNQAATATWRALDSLCGDEDSLYALALPSPVRRVDVEWEDISWEYLRPALADARPTHLLLHYCPVQPVWNVSLWNLSEDLLQGSAVTHFALDVNPNAIEITVASLVEQLLDMIADTNIVFFALRLQSLPLEEESAYAPGDERRLDAVPQLQDLARAILPDLQGTALPPLIREMAVVAPALQHVVVDAQGEEPTYWRILRKGERITLTSLEPEKGEAVVRAEGMEWHRRAPEPPRFDESKRVSKESYSDAKPSPQWGWDESSDVEEALQVWVGGEGSRIETHFEDR